MSSHHADYDFQGAVLALFYLLVGLTGFALTAGVVAVVGETLSLQIASPGVVWFGATIGGFSTLVISIARAGKLAEDAEGDSDV